MPVPYTFAAATSSNSLGQLDANFATGITLGNTVVQLGNTIVTLNNITLVNATITSLSGALVTLGSTPLTAGATVTTVAGLTLTGSTLTSPTIATIVNSGTLTLPTATDTLVARATTDTLTNKRVTPRLATAAPAGGSTVTLVTDNFDAYDVTVPASGTTTFAASGTPTGDQPLHVSLTSAGAPATIAWSASFEASSVALPTAVGATGVRKDLKFVWNTVTSKWRIILSA